MLHTVYMWAFTVHNLQYVYTISRCICLSFSPFQWVTLCSCAHCLFSAWLQTWAFLSVCVFLCVPVNLDALYVYVCVSLCCHLSGGAVFPRQPSPAGHQITAVYYTDRLTHWTIIIPLNHSLSPIFSIPGSHSSLLIHSFTMLEHLHFSGIEWIWMCENHDKGNDPVK